MILSKKVAATTIFTIVAMLSFFLPCLADDTVVITDSPGYGPGEVLTIFGAGWDAGETVALLLYTDLDPVNPYMTLSSMADGNGFFINTNYTIQPQDSGRTFTLIATGQSSGLSAQTVFEDAPHVHLFEDASRTILRDAFACGTALYARGDDLGTTKPCWQIQWIDPNDTVVETHNLDATLTDNRDDSFAVPPGPSGIWQAELWEPDTVGSDCSAENYTLRATEFFDVAQVVIIGAANDGYAVQNLGNFNSDTSLFFFRLDVQSWSFLGARNERSFIHFDLTGIASPLVSSKLRLLLYNPPVSSRTYDMHRITGSWNEGTLTWNNAPGVAGSITDSQTVGTIPGHIRWDVTSDVDGFMNSAFTNYGWRLRDSAENNSPLSRQGHFWSSEFDILTGQKIFGPVLLIDNLRSTSTTVTCDSPVLVGQGATCTATVTDTAGAGPSAPTGTVSFSTDNTGNFSNPGVACTLSPTSSDRSSCMVTYTPSVSGNHAVGADYGGSLVHAYSLDATDFNLTANRGPIPVPAMTVRGMNIFVVLAGLLSIMIMKKKRA